MQWFTSNKDTLAVCGNEVGLNSGAAWWLTLLAARKKGERVSCGPSLHFFSGTFVSHFAFFFLAACCMKNKQKQAVVDWMKKRRQCMERAQAASLHWNAVSFEKSHQQSHKSLIDCGEVQSLNPWQKPVKRPTDINIWPLCDCFWGSNMFVVCLWWVRNLRILKQSVVRAPKDAVLKLIFPWHLPSSTEEKLTEKIMLKKRKVIRRYTRRCL